MLISKELLKEFDDWWKSNGFTSRSEAFRTLIRMVLKQGFTVTTVNAIEGGEGMVE